MPGGEQPGDGGVGYSWFVVELDTSDVVGPEPKPYVPIPGPASRSTRPRRERGEDRFEGQYRVVESATDRFGGSLFVSEPQRFAGIFDVVESIEQRFSATLDTSTLRFQCLQEEELLLLMADE